MSNLANLQKLEVFEQQKPERIGKLSHLKGEHPIYCVEIKDLKFNPYNHRFAVQIKKRERELKTELGFDENSQRFLSELIAKENKEKNSQDYEDIRKNGVLRPIVIDSRGIVIDGNRRIFLIRGIINNPDKYPTTKFSNGTIEVFVIKPEEFLSKKQITKFETPLQMSESERLECSRVNLYVHVEKLLEDAGAEDDNAKFREVSDQIGAKYKVKDIQRMHEIFIGVMTDYLKHFSVLDEVDLLDKREDHFKFIKDFKEKHKELERKTYDDALEILYALTSILYEGKKFRKILKLGFWSSGESVDKLKGVLEDEGIFDYVKKSPSKPATENRKKNQIKESIKAIEQQFKSDFPADTFKDLIEGLEKNSLKIHALLTNAKMNLDYTNRLKEVKDKIIKIIERNNVRTE